MQSPSPQQDQFVEKSAFDEDNEEEEENNDTSQFEESKATAVESGNPTKKRTLSDVAAEKGASGQVSQQTTTGTSDGSNQQEPELTPREA